MKAGKKSGGRKKGEGRAGRLFAICLAAVMLASLPGCGSDGGRENGGSVLQPGGEESAAADQSSLDGAEEASITAMGRYMETKIALPQGADVVGRTWTLLEDGSLIYLDPSAGMFQADGENVQWQTLKSGEAFAAVQEGYVTGSAAAADGSAAFCRIDFSGGEEERHVRIFYYDPEGGSLEIDGNLGENDWLHKVFFGRDSGLYAVSQQGQICELDVHDGTVKPLFLAAQRPEMLAFSGKLLLALEDDRVEIYDLEQGLLLDTDTVLNDFCAENLKGKLGNTSDCVGGYLIGEEEGIIYIAYSGGVYRHVLGGTVMEKLIDGDFSTFGDPSEGICALLLTQGGEFLLLTTGEEAVRFTYDPNEPSVPENLLTVYSLREDYGAIRQAISMFQNEHPDVNVRLEIGIPNDSAITLTDALKNLNVELMSGKGPDVLLLDGLNAPVYMEKGQLLDLSDVLNSLSGEDAAFENIVGAYRTEAGVYAVPATFSVPLICGKEEDVRRVTDLASLAQLAEEKKENTAYATVTGSVTAQQELKRLMAVCSPAWLSGTELDTEALSEFLRQAKRIYDADLAAASPEMIELWSNNSATGDIGNSLIEMMLELSQISYGLASGMLEDVGAVAHFVEDEEGYCFDIWKGQTSEGFVPGYKFAVAAGSGKPELAKEFVRMMLSENVQNQAFSYLLPVNRAAFEKRCEWNEISLGGGVLTPEGQKRFAIVHPKEETTDRLRELVEQLDYCLEGNSMMEEAVMKYGAQVLLGYESVEEGVEDIVRAVSIYLAEQR